MKKQKLIVLCAIKYILRILDKHEITLIRRFTLYHLEWIKIIDVLVISLKWTGYIILRSLRLVRSQLYLAPPHTHILLKYTQNAHIYLMILNTYFQARPHLFYASILHFERSSDYYFSDSLYRTEFFDERWHSLRNVHNYVK